MMIQIIKILSCVFIKILSLYVRIFGAQTYFGYMKWALDKIFFKCKKYQLSQLNSMSLNPKYIEYSMFKKGTLSCQF
jgi:hypothetical protein